MSLHKRIPRQGQPVAQGVFFRLGHGASLLNRQSELSANSQGDTLMQEIFYSAGQLSDEPLDFHRVELDKK